MSTSAPRPIAPPPLSQHLRELASRRDAWLILVRNAIPVVGIYFFDWSAALAVFNYWWDGFTALAAIIAALVPRAMRETADKSGKPRGPIKAFVLGTVTWLFLVGILGLPYWIVLIPLGDMIFGNEVRQALMHTPALWATFGGLAIAHAWKAFHIGYDAMPENELKQRVRWDFYLLVLRAIAMFMMASHGLAFIMVPLMAIVLSYFEIWPARVIGAVFGDPSELYTYDPETGQRDKD